MQAYVRLTYINNIKLYLSDIALWGEKRDVRN